MPTGNLPEKPKRLFEQVYKDAKASGDSEEKAAKKAWGAVHNAGWFKGQDGQWHKKADVVEFSLAIKKASFDPETKEMRWRADTSDIDLDSHGDKMSMDLFQDFLGRIESKEPPAYEEFRSEFWSGGMPYLSISHYPDLNGNAVPGVVDAVFVDGKFFKAKGRFNDTQLGKACWKAIKSDLEKKSEGVDPVRISIAFLDYKHRHLDSGYLFERNLSEDEPDFCPECLKAALKGTNPTVEYLRGHLIHLAMTRVPVNKRTIMEVDKSMTTRKQDAASIVGDELAEEIEEKAALVGKSEALVIKADDETEAEEPIQETPVEVVPEVVEEKAEVLDPENMVMEALTALSQKIDRLADALMSRSEMKDKKDDEEEDEMEDNEEEEMKKKEQMKAEVIQPPAIDLAVALSEAMGPVVQRLDMLIAAQAPHKAEVPQRRSISPAAVPQISKAQIDPNRPMSIAEIARRSVGLE